MLALLRDTSGSLSPAPLEPGAPTVAELDGVGQNIDVRRLSLGELLDLETGPLELGGTARVVLAIVERARRSLAEGLVHPHLQAGDGSWHGLWGATIDESVRDELDEIADAAPGICATAFDGDIDAFVDDLYGCAIDELARRALHGVRATPPSRLRDSAPERLLAALHSDDPTLPADGGYAALERRLSAWVDGGLGRRSRAPWNVGPPTRRADGRARRRLARRRRAAAPGGRRPDARASGIASHSATRTSSRSFETAIRAERSSAASRRSARSSPTPASLHSTRRRPRQPSTTTRCARSSHARDLGSRSSACPCSSREPGSRRRAVCASTSSPQAHRRRPADS